MVESWAETDISASSFKHIAKNREYFFDKVSRFLFCENQYQKRLAIVIFLDHFVCEQFVDKIFDLLKSVKYGDYYVDMAVAWLLSVCFVKFRDKTLEIMSQRIFPKFVQNKAIQKCKESLRVPKQDKILIGQLKI